MNSTLAELLKFPYFDHYLELAAIEAEAAGIGADDQILFIGGGPLPLTPLALAILQLAEVQGLRGAIERAVSKQPADLDSLAGALNSINTEDFKHRFQVIALDLLLEATQKARQAVRRLNLAHLVRVEQEDGSTCRLPDDVSVIFVASMAEPKGAILDNILRQREHSGRTRIIVRSVPDNNLRQLLYDPLPDTLFGDLNKRYPALRRRAHFVPPKDSRLINSFEVYEISSV